MGSSASLQVPNRIDSASAKRLAQECGLKRWTKNLDSSFEDMKSVSKSVSFKQANQY
jgi:hypothetical protein